MTRYARSKGSKSSNERIPNDSTPWHVMKQQLKPTVEKEEPQPKLKSARQLLQEKSAENTKTEWFKFDNITSTNAIKINKNKKKLKDKNKKSKNHNESIKNGFINGNSKIVDDFKIINDEKEIKSKENKLKRKNNNSLQIDSNLYSLNEEKKELIQESIQLDINHLNKNDEKYVKTPSNPVLQDKKSEVKKKNTNETCTEFNSPMSKRQKRNQKKLHNKKERESNTIFNERENNYNHQIHSNKNGNYNNRFNNNIPRKYQKKTAKIRDDKVHPRRKPDYGTLKVTINGVNVEIVKYNGFPVIKKDAERLIDLRKQMVLKGIPKFEIDAAMKLERRKCEKALARIRREVCFHCRKAGHNLSACPELEKEEIITGICFKCGSTEHTHFECKVTKSDDYKYAKCFICREQGHIAKQCPDNPKGLYPDGGSCKICGDVTHLKKDCPDLVKEKEEATITLNTISYNNLESLDDSNNIENSEAKTTKIVKF